MRHNDISLDGIKKLHIKETVTFAINHVPEVESATLEKFLELINTTGTFGKISHNQILGRMQQTLKYIPNACPHSLMVVADLLDIPRSTSVNNHPPSTTARLQSSQTFLSSSKKLVQFQIPLANAPQIISK